MLIFINFFFLFGFLNSSDDEEFLTNSGIDYDEVSVDTTENIVKSRNDASVQQNNHKDAKHEIYFSSEEENSGDKDLTAEAKLIILQGDDKISPIYYWGGWKKWSECSRNCGGGVQSKKRNCIKRYQGIVKIIELLMNTSCSGVYERFKMCNDMPCFPDVNGEEFRRQQCVEFNNIDYYSRKYNWESYFQAENECELTCKPENHNYFAVLKSSVIDGTPCRRPVVFYQRGFTGRAVCVKGLCKAVHPSGLIRGTSTTDSKHKCGSVLCQPTLETFDKELLPYGRFLVKTFLPGTINLTITEMGKSKNVFAIKVNETNRFLVNGDQQSSSGVYKYKENRFIYNNGSSGDAQNITVIGILTNSFHFILQINDKNPGIKLEYFTVTPSGSDDSYSRSQGWNEITTSSVNRKNNIENAPRKSRFMWKIVSFGPCTRSCGGGRREPVYRCIKSQTGFEYSEHEYYYTSDRCQNAERPYLNANIFICNSQPCPTYWQVSDWSECHCYAERGYQSRVAKCLEKRPISSGKDAIFRVADSNCSEEKPQTRKSCQCSVSSSNREKVSRRDVRYNFAAQ